MRRAISAALVFMGLTILFPSIGAAAPEEGIFHQVKGKVTVIGLDRSRRAAKPGGFVKANEIIETKAKSYAKVVMPSGSVMVVRENSRVEVADSRTNKRGNSSVVTYVGRVWASIVGADDGSTAFEVTTPTAVAGVRGTEFTIGVGKDGSTRVGVDKGRVTVVADTGQVDIESGEETTVDWDAAPTEASAYNPDEAVWKEWVLDRQDKLVRHGKRIVPLIMKDVRKARLHMFAVKKKGDRLFKRLKRRADAANRRGREFKLSNRQKREIVKYIEEVVDSLKELHRTDRQMMARYYIVQQIHEDTRQNPDQYDPEFIELMEEVVDELEEIDVEEIHRQNREVITAYIDFIDEFAREHKLGKYKDGEPEDRKQKLIDAREKLRESE